ncbi:hypothetical protein CF319_g8727 [Tilletia indica]|nr:hypothetical protein CF319_g8727 [Tilletia indica]
MSRISEVFREGGAEGTYEDLVDRSYILINGMNPSETAFLETFKVGSDQHPTRRVLERCCLFGCGECGEPFSRTANLVRHWEIHRRQLIADISAGSDETIELSRSAEFQGLAVARAEAARVPSPPSSRAVATRVTQALERLAGPVPTQELLPAPTQHIRYMVTALMGMFAVSLLLTMIQLNIESYNGKSFPLLILRPFDWAWPCGPQYSTPPISAAPEAPLPGPELAQPSAPTAAESLIADTTRSKPRAPDYWAEL